MIPELSWKPASRGEIYCAPACGRGCTRGEFDAATGKAAALAGDLGDGWKPDVWENLGWHWAAVKGGLKIHPNILNRGYTAFLGEAASHGGRWTESGRTAKSAVRNVIRQAKKEVRLLLTMIREAE